VRVEWCGHSYLVIRPPGGPVIAIDPHDGGSVGLPECRVSADYTLITHNHFDHNAAEMSGGKVVRWRYGEFRLGPIKVEGLRFHHDRSGGTLRGDTAAYILEVGDVRIAHLGDIGHVPSSSAIRALEGVDLLALPVGGVYTIDAIEANVIVELVKPKLVLPLHYWIPGVTLPLDPVERFLQTSRARRLRLEEAVFEVEPGLPAGRPTILIPEKTATGRRSLL
jgi:L-ascorbate metabolism protein UlaG (beta-lactamase superfamily)